MRTPLLHVHHKDPVTDACRILASGRLKSDAFAIAADDRIRRLVATVLSPMSHACEVLAVRLELQLPDVDVVRILLELLTARFHKCVLSVWENAFDLVVLASYLAIDGNL